MSNTLFAVICIYASFGIYTGFCMMLDALFPIKRRNRRVK